MSSDPSTSAAGAGVNDTLSALLLALSANANAGGNSRETPAERKASEAKLAALPEPREGGARKAETVRDVPAYPDNPCPRPEGGAPALCAQFDCVHTRGYVAVEKTGSRGAMYEYKNVYACIAFLHDTVKYFGELLAGDEPADKKSLHVVYTHAKAVLDLLVLRADYLKLRGEEAKTRPGLVRAAEHLLEGPSSYPVSSAALLDIISSFKDLEVKSSLRVTGGTAAPPGGGGYHRHSEFPRPSGGSDRAPGGGRGGRGGRGGGVQPRGLGAYNTRSSGGAAGSTGE